MSIIYILIPIAVLLTSIGIYIFFWAVRTEQFDDLEKQGMSILFDEKEQEKQAKSKSSDNHDDSNNEDLNSDNSTSDNK
jgi:cbb3-type cytochrome oxidase maturation protein